MIKTNTKITALLLVVLLMTLVACTVNRDRNHTPLDNENQGKEQGESKPPEEIDNGDDRNEVKEPTEEEEKQEPVDLKALKVNELGKIMVLMYHGIGEKEDVWVRTPENFRKDLKTLYDNGYRAIGMKDYIEGNISTPPGTTPVILTFDDGLQGQFNVIEGEDGFEVDPDSAVGILEEFNKEYPDFGLKATFYVFYPIPFRQEKWINTKFEYLIDKGMEIGNHGYSHENLRMDMNTKEPRNAQFIQKALGKNVKHTREILPDYNVDSLALPYGAFPKDTEMHKYVVKGDFEGIEYHHKAVLLVGANPARPSYHKNTDMAKVPRIRASEMETEGLGLYDWLDHFERNPEERYISDGNPQTISFPTELKEFLNMDAIGDKTIQPYE